MFGYFHEETSLIFGKKIALEMSEFSQINCHVWEYFQRLSIKILADIIPLKCSKLHTIFFH